MSKEFTQVPLKKNSKLEQEIQILQKRIYSPKVDLIDTGNSYLIRIELPGINKNSIKIQIKENQIVLISGKKESYELSENENIIYKESKYDTFMRRVKLPSSIKYKEFNNLNFQNGILLVSFDKKIDTPSYVHGELEGTGQGSNGYNYEKTTLFNFDTTKNWADM